MYIIGVAGGSGSGKSTFANRIKDAFSSDVLVLSSDNYYLPHDDIPKEERDLMNFDEPRAIDFSLMAKHLQMLKSGKAVNCPVYDFSLHTRKDETILITPPKVLLLDGILLFANGDILKNIDLKIYVDSDADERILRRLARDVKERGRTVESVIEQYLTCVKPMHEKYVEPTKKLADIVVNNIFSDGAFEIVKSKIINILEER